MQLLPEFKYLLVFYEPEIVVFLVYPLAQFNYFTFCM